MHASVDELASILRQQAAEALSSHPELNHVWTDEGAVLNLRFPPADAGGFEVAIQVGEGYVYVLMGRNHEHFDVDPRNPANAVKSALGLVRDLLSPQMRLREATAGGMPYRWFVERNNGSTWELQAETGLLLFNFFGRRSERLFQNHQLPGR